MMSWSSFDACKFCHSNGEAEAQYRSHLVKNSSGLVTCPVLRSFTCPICKATGDFAHTQRYCPLNKDGQFNSGASLTELKKKKNAAGNFPSCKKMMWPLHSYSKACPPSCTVAAQSLPPPPFKRTSSLLSPGTSSYKMTTDPLSHHPMTDPLPSCYRPPSPPTMLPSQPPSAQLSLYRHLQYLEFYQQKQLQHEAEIAMLQASGRLPASRSSPICYMRNFPSPMSTTPPDKFLFPDGEEGCGRAKALVASTAGKNKMNGAADVDFLGNMLAELREGTEEMDIC